MKWISFSDQSFETFQKTSHTTNNRHSSTKTNNERKFTGSADKTSWSYFSSSVNSFLRYSYIDSKIYLTLSRHSTTIFRNFVAEFGRPVFAELGGEGVILLWLADVGGLGEIFPPGKTASLNTFTCECTIRYHTVVMTVVRGRGRSGCRVSLCSCGYSSVVE